jgi:hypothetical protein
LRRNLKNFNKNQQIYIFEIPLIITNFKLMVTFNKPKLRNMNSKIFLLILLLSITPRVFSQADDDVQSETARIFLKIYSSYGMFTRGSYTLPVNTSSQNSTTIAFTEQQKGMGAGLRFGAGIGLYLNRRINLGIDGEYLKGSLITSARNDQLISQKFVYDKQQPDTSISTSRSELAHNIVSIIPHITFKAINTANYYIYTRVGLIIAIPMNITQKDNVTNLHTNGTSRIGAPAPGGPLPSSYDNESYYVMSVRSSESEYKSNPGIGYQASLGIQFAIRKNLAFFLEVTSNNLILQPSELEQTDSKETITQKYYKKATTVTIDNKRSIRQFKKDGDYISSTSGTFPNQIYYTSSPRINMAVNSLNFGGGIAFRF